MTTINQAKEVIRTVLKIQGVKYTVLVLDEENQTVTIFQRGKMGFFLLLISVITVAVFSIWPLLQGCNPLPFGLAVATKTYFVSRFVRWLTSLQSCHSSSQRCGSLCVSTRHLICRNIHALCALVGEIKDYVLWFIHVVLDLRIVRSVVYQIKWIFPKYM